MRRQNWWHVVSVNAKARGPALTVLYVLSHHATRNGYVGLPLPIIAEFSGFTVRTVRECLKALVRDRDIMTVRSGGGGRTHALYRITVPAIREVDTKRYRVKIVEVEKPEKFPSLRLMEEPGEVP